MVSDGRTSFKLFRAWTLKKQPQTTAPSWPLFSGCLPTQWSSSDCTQKRLGMKKSATFNGIFTMPSENVSLPSLFSFCIKWHWMDHVWGLRNLVFLYSFTISCTYICMKYKKNAHYIFNMNCNLVISSSNLLVSLWCHFCWRCGRLSFCPVQTFSGLGLTESWFLEQWMKANYMLDRRLEFTRCRGSSVMALCSSFIGSPSKGLWAQKKNLMCV